MAKDDFNMDWDDPFGGEFDLDMDFDMDPYAKRGFVGGVTSGFLSGVVDETVGSGEARMRTLRTILPPSFSNALDRVSWASTRLNELTTDFKEQNYESTKSLQSIAGHLAEKASAKGFGRLASGMENFSQKDFSSWEKYDYSSGDRAPTMETPDEYDVSRSIEESMNRQEGMFASLGESLNQMSAHVGGMLNGAIMSGNKQLISIDSGVRQLLDYQRNVQYKMDQAKINLMAKSYTADIKYYKFMEKGLHTEIAELKKIVLNSGKSDYEKTSNFTASKAYMRNRLFNTVGNRVGGLSGLMRDKFGKNARNEVYSDMNNILGGFAEILEMSSDIPMSKGMVGSMVGKRLAESLINNAPYFFERGKGRDWINKLAAKNPARAKQFQEQYAKLSKVGHKGSYMANNATGLINYMAEDWQNLDEMPFLDYQDYVDSLPTGQKAMGRARWEIQNAASNRGKAAINSMMSEMTKARGTQYTLARRNVKDLNQPGIWKEMNNITLNEVLPGLLGRIHQSVEGLRTGEMKEMTSYSHMRGQFMDAGDRKSSVAADLMPYSEFSRYSSAALEFVDSIDPGKQLSSSARKAFAQQIARDVDKEKGFNPFYYLGDIPGVSSSVQKEIHAVVKRHFDLDAGDVDLFKSTSGLERVNFMSTMKNDKAQERLNKAGAAAQNLKEIFPNVAERIDLLRSTGNEQMLRDLGVIYTENGIDKVNMEIFHSRIGQFMDNPNDPTLRGMSGKSSGPGATKPGFTIPKQPSSGGSGNNELGGVFGELNSNVSKLTDVLAQFDKPLQGSPEQGSISDKFGSTVTDHLGSISSHTGKIETMMEEFMQTVRDGKLFSRKQTSSEERQEAQTKRNFMDKVKDLFPSNIFGRGMDMLMANSPIVFGSLLGTVGASFVQNPLLAGSMIAGGALLGGVVQRWGKEDQKAAGDKPADTEDILDDKGETLLSSAKLNAGIYIDAITKRVIKTWQDIRGPIFDTAEKVVIGIKELGAKIFGPDGRAVVLSGIETAKNAIISGYQFVDPIGRIKAIAQMGKELIYQQDVYVKGEKNPRLRAAGFKSREYFIDDNGNYHPIAGWNEIKGAVYDSDANQLISEEEYAAGLVTATGQAVRGVGAFTSNVVGSGLGLARTGFDNLMGRFGFQRASEQSGGKGGRVSGSGVERRLDRIYALLSKQFGIGVDDAELGDILGGSTEERLNSLADKEKKAKEASQEKTNEAIQDIASSLSGGTKEDKPTEKKGLFGRLLEMMGGLGTFGMNLIRNPIGTIGGAILGSLGASASRLGKIGSLLFSGVMGVASPIYKLLKWGFTGLGKMLGGGALGGLGSLLGGAGRRGGTLAGIGRGLMRMPGWAKAAGAAAIAGGSLYAGTNLFGEDPEVPNVDEFGNPVEPIYEQPRTKSELDYLARQEARAARDKQNGSSGFMDQLADFVPQNWAAKGILGFMGMDVDKQRDGKIFSDDGKLFLSKAERDAYEDQRDGVIAPSSLTRDVAKTFTIQKRIRYAQYGLRHVDNNLALRIDQLEQNLTPYVTIIANRGGLRDDVPIDKIVKQFAAGGGNIPFDQAKTWFMARFKPIFLIYNVGISVARLGDINEFDLSTSPDVRATVERLKTSITTVEPYPLKIAVQIDPEVGIMHEYATNERVQDLMVELQKQFPEEKQNLKLATADEIRKKNLEVEERSSNPIIGAAQDFFGRTAAADQQRKMDERFKSPAEVQEIDISDLHPAGSSDMDPFTWARLAVYGNVDNMPWRVDAVLKLERYTENLFNVIGEEIKFIGVPAKVLQLFKPMFRIEDPLSESRWLDWYENRFLPVLSTYIKRCQLYRSGKPQRVWQQLSATNKVVIARELAEIRVFYQDKEVGIWEVTVGPFPNSVSGSANTRAEKFLKMLDIKATQARLKEPELEEEKSKTAQERAANTKPDRDTVRNNTNRVFDQVYGKNRQMASGNVGINGGGSGMAYGVNGRPSVSGGSGWANIANDAAQGGRYDGNFAEGFNPEFEKQAGDDRGIRFNPEEGERLMLNTMLKHGITDKKQIALGLAMAKKETGNYSSTVENTNWSAQTLQKLFRNIPDAATAQKVAGLSPMQRAMYVYGRAPKGPTLGNEKPEDGWLYRGRGLFQLTGKANYKKFQEETGAPVVDNPRLVSEDPQVMAESAVRFLKNSKAMMDIGKTGNFETAVRGINGGNAVPGTDERRKYYQEYLQKLNNGELSVPMTVETQGDLEQETASAADTTANGGTLGGANAKSKDRLDEQLNAGDTTRNVSTATATPKQSGTQSAAAPSVVQTPAPASAPSSPGTVASSGSSKSTLTPPASIAKPAPVTEVKLPDGPLKVQDEQLANVMAALTQSLDNLNKSVSQQQRGNSGVTL